MNAQEVTSYMIEHNTWAPPQLVADIVNRTKVDGWHCPNCGTVRILHRSAKYIAKLGRTCGSSECNPNYGKKRPQHSAHMKALAASGTNDKFQATLMTKGKLHNKNVNTPEFFIQVLSNQGIEATQANWKGCLSTMLSNRGKDRSNRTKTLVTKFSKWDTDTKHAVAQQLGFNIAPDQLNSLSDTEFESVFKILHGIQSTVNMENMPNTGRNTIFKQITVTNPQYNIDGKTEVKTRSGTEASYISLFERLGIPWRYEAIRIQKNPGGYYKPDFFIMYNGRNIILEVKGSYYRTTEQEFLATRAEPAAKFAKTRGWEYCISRELHPKDMSFLETALYI